MGYFYQLKDSNEWWWQPLPKFVTDVLANEEIQSICKMQTSTLVLYHNSLVDTVIEQGGIETETPKQRALLWVLQGEAWRRELKIKKVYGVAVH